MSYRAQALGILPLVLAPEFGDFNEDLRRLSPERLIANLRAQLVLKRSGLSARMIEPDGEGGGVRAYRMAGLCRSPHG